MSNYETLLLNVES